MPRLSAVGISGLQAGEDVNSIAPLAQLVERLFCTQEVEGSIPAWGFNEGINHVLVYA